MFHESSDVIDSVGTLQKERGKDSYKKAQPPGQQLPQKSCTIEKKLFRNNRFRFYFFGLSGLLVVSTFIGIQLNNTKQTNLNNTEVRTSIIQKQTTETKTNFTIAKKQSIQEKASINNKQQQINLSCYS